MPETEGKNGRRLRIKIISMGAPETGKSCLIKRYCEKRFVSKYMSTIGIDYGVTKYQCDGYDVSVNIFDMAGQRFFYEVRNEFYRDSQGALLVYDVARRATFDLLGEWLVEMKTHLPQPSNMDDVIVAVCANKTDVSRREVTEREGRLWAEPKGFLYFETSAQTGQNVTEMFHTLFSAVVTLATEGKKPPGMNFDLKYTPEQNQDTSSPYQDDLILIFLLRDEVNRSYRQLAVQLHPDKNQAPGSAEAFKELARAREDLLTNR